MPTSDRRTQAQIREQIRAERAQLEAALAELGADAKRTGRLAAFALGGLTGVLLVRRLVFRR
jgi:hypothetical protein